MILSNTVPVLEQLKALSHEIRFELVRHLAQSEHCVCELGELLNLPQPSVSYHLGILRDAELITAEPRGKNVYYVLRQQQFFGLSGALLSEVFTNTLPLTPDNEPKR